MSRRISPDHPARRGWCPGLERPMPTGDGLLARVHPPLGMLSPVQARAVAEGARRYGNGHLDVTGRANLQIRGVREETREPLARMLGAVGLGDARSDGGPQRLTLTGPLAGRDPAEILDVPRLARAIEAAALSIAGLPAKTLVAVEGCPGGPVPDADFFVRPAAPRRVQVAVAADGFPRVLLACDADRAPAAVAALLAAFAQTGRRRARDLGEDERERLVLAATAMTSPAPALADRTEGAPVAVLRAGLSIVSPTVFALAVDAPFGRCTADALDRLAAAADDLGTAEIRLSWSRGFVLLTGETDRARAALAALAEDFITLPDDPRRAVAACTGAPACASGTTATLADADALAERFRPLAARGLSAHVSGCAKGCARPGPADLTLVGRDGLYGVVVGGGPGDIPALRLPIEAVRERLGRAASVGLAAAFAAGATGIGEDRRAG